jgi:predicted dehydrogenase/threonine dehydrogenase-like Zn-dependent dehydrogenase
MKQIIQSYRSGELWLADVPAPALRGGGAVVQTAASLVSPGTERMIVELAKKSLLGKAAARPDLVRKVIDKIKTEGLGPTMTKVFAKLDTPIPLGYSCAGSVVEAGGSSGVRAGDRVACAGAGYATHAEFNFVPRNLCVPLPATVSFEDAAYATLGSIALQGVRQADLRLGESVAVIGLGLLGLLTVQLLKASGCRVIGSDLDPHRCQLANDLGADEVIGAGLAEAALGFSNGYGVDAVIITAATTSNEPIEVAAEACRTKGRVVIVGLVGMDVPRDPFYKKELDLRLSMSYGPGRYDPAYEEAGHDYPYAYVRWTEQRNIQAFLDLVAAGKVTPSRLTTHRFAIDEALKAYDLLGGKTGERSLGIVIEYPVPAAGASVEPPSRRVTLQGSVQPVRGKLGIGFVGAGNFAKSVLLPALGRRDDVQLTGICTATGMSGVETGKRHGFRFAATDVGELLNDPATNAVFIATQHHTHADFICQALEAGKSVFCEKPLCTTPEQLDQIERRVAGLAQPGPCLMVGFNRRFSPHAVAVREAFRARSSPLVVNYRVNAGMAPLDSWVQDPDRGGGRIVGEVCHFADLAEFLVGSSPERLYASSIRTADRRDVAEDSLVVTINYADGSLATIQYLAHGSSQVPKERGEICADGATAVIDNFRQTTFFGGRGRGVTGKQDKGFDAELAAFLNAMREGSPWPISFDSLARTTRATFAILESLFSGKPVQLA